MSPADTRRFSYRHSWIKMYFAVLLLAWALGFILWPLWVRPAGWISLEIVFSVPGFLFLLALFINGCFVTSDVEVSTDSISWRMCGWRWKDIKWANVDHIHVYEYWDSKNRRKGKKFYVFENRKSLPYFLPGGGMGFVDAICDADALKGIMKSQVERRGIRIEGQEFG